MPQNSDPQIRELTSESDWMLALEVLRELRPELDVHKSLADRTRLMASGYALFGLWSDDSLACVAGICLHPHILRGIDFWVHDLVVRESARSHGLGKLMMRFLEERARARGCDRMLVYTQATRERARNFYENHLGYERYAITYRRNIEPLKE